MRRYTFLFLAIVLLVFSALPLLAHHGWGWATDQEFEITGRVVDATLGNPHGEVIIEVDGALWTIEVGQPWRNSRAGLDDSDFAEGTLITFHGHRSANPEVNLVKAERLVINNRDYNLYPDRES